MSARTRGLIEVGPERELAMHLDAATRELRLSSLYAREVHGPDCEFAKKLARLAEVVTELRQGEGK